MQQLPSRFQYEEAISHHPLRSVSPSSSNRTLTARPSHSFHRSMSSSVKEGKPVAPKSLSSKINDYWILEIASCFGSIGCLVGIVVFLNEYNGKPLPEWSYGITVNSILSWLVQILTALILEPIAASLSQTKCNNLGSPGCKLSDINMYDFASRGVLGCVSLIWQSRLRTLACLGAFITILSTGAGPFVQQMATVQNKLVPNSGPTTVAFSKGYVEYLGLGLKSELPAADILAATYSSVFGGSGIAENNLTRIRINPDCPTGECEFPPFRSLAACSTCTDISDMISTNCIKYWCATDTTHCSHSLPNGLALNATLRDQKAGPTGKHCLVYWCVNTYKAGMRNNNPWEELVDTYDNLERSMYGAQNYSLEVPSKGILPSSKYWISAFNLRWWVALKLNVTSTSACYGGVSPVKQIYGNEFADPMIRYGMSDFCERLAYGIATGARLYNNSHIRGTSKIMETQIRVRWAWIILPASLTVFSVVFLCVTIVQTRKGEHDVWKSSPTPLVCANLDQRAHTFICTNEYPMEIEDSASQVMVQFHKASFVTVNFLNCSGLL
ncbi:hypothetical protein BDV25DRAFT_131148 [Aspergillus avenaceus]|uniref:Uncharacterized protein n=1 Tax=Aspergillus avenaceus TaxID=36643 RepID=A0A5N6TQA4_ASPAV|nr:hypothetical protein BDV25DRAFT_131148 [Aspergillus avenaceus]